VYVCVRLCVCVCVCVCVQLADFVCRMTKARNITVEYCLQYAALTQSHDCSSQPIDLHHYCKVVSGTLLGQTCPQNKESEVIQGCDQNAFQLCIKQYAEHKRRVLTHT
jgi:hypothetical protein